jgi:hypothetical protein
MTREERIAKNEAWEAKQRKKDECLNNIRKNYKSLSYRDKLLFMIVMNFLRDNPQEEA